MRVTDVAHVEGKGHIAVVEDVPIGLHRDDELVRKSDGKVWGMIALDYAGYRSGGDTIGIVLGSQDPPKVGDALTYNAVAVTTRRLQKRCDEQQKRIERLELALVLKHLETTPHGRVVEAGAAALVRGENVWLQPMKDKEGIHFLRVESSKKEENDDGGN